MSEVKGLKGKIKTGITNLKSHWNKPPEGYYVSYKEFFNLAMGLGSPSFLSVIISWTSITINIPLMISYFKVSTGFVFFAGIITSLLGLLRAPILSMIIDNSNSPKGKFKPFLPITSIMTAICFTVIPFIPEKWVSEILFSFTIPEMNLLGVAASKIEISLASFVMLVLVQIGTFFYTFLTQCLVGIEQTISPVSQERANIGALKGLVSNIPGSVVNVVLPFVAGIVFASSETPMNNVELYRWAFPICAVGGVAILAFAYFGTEERTVVDKKYVAKVKFLDGAKQLITNKYFWIITIYTIAVGVRGNINMYYWICNYAIGGKNGAMVLGICNILLNNAFIPGMIFGPYLIKKLGKRKVMIVSTVGFTVMAFLQLFTLDHPYVMLVVTFMQNLFNGLSYVSAIMVPDVLDYQQWKTGKRLEGFWQNCSSFILTAFGLLTSSLVPFVMSLGGIGFGDDIDIALKNSQIMHNVFSSMTWLGIISSVICIIPMLFYDLTEEKHERYIKSLKIRAVVENYKNNCLSADDVESLYKITEKAKEQNDEFIITEISKHDSVKKILKLKKEI